jgi:hypothetical protein
MNRSTARVACLLFGSGLCALVYEIAWLREFRLVYGASTAASAAVLAVFIGGLGVGGLFIGKRADRVTRPLALYALLEAAVAVLAALSPFLLIAARGAYVALGGIAALGAPGATAVRLLLTVLVLLGPTFLMGGTLPAAVRATTSESDATRRTVGLLYGCNTVGAVVGCVAANFWLLEALGTRRTLWLASAMNLAVAALAYAVSRWGRGDPAGAIATDAKHLQWGEEAAASRLPSGSSSRVRASSASSSFSWSSFGTACWRRFWAARFSCSASSSPWPCSGSARGGSLTRRWRQKKRRSAPSP